MQRRFGLRACTDFSVLAQVGSMASQCRGVEVSASGIVLDRGRAVMRRDEPLLLHLELFLPERVRSIRALARLVWSRGTKQGFRFVRMSDADRLTIAEHLDVLRFKGVAFA
jgi:hypothetical protein